MIMDDLLRRLEKQITGFIEEYNATSERNRRLHSGHHQLAREKEQLLAKQQKAIHQIESLVSKLKAIEKIS